MVQKIIAPKELIIYIGTHKHSRQHSNCHSKAEQLRQTCCVFFDRSGKWMKLTAYRCPRCEKIFMSGQIYEKHWYELSGYQFCYSWNGRPTSESLVCREMHPIDYVEPLESVDWDEVYKTPPYIVQALRHPYSGGRFSGK